MKRIALAMAAIGAAAAVIVPASGQNGGEVSPVYGISIPPGYRGWRLISVSREDGSFNQLRAQLGNDIAVRAFRAGTRPFPDGAMIAALHWDNTVSEEDNKVFGRTQAFVPGSARNVQFMIKDVGKYPDTAGWGFADFTDGKPASEATHKACFSCHQPAKANDFVFTHYAP